MFDVIIYYNIWLEICSFIKEHILNIKIVIMNAKIIDQNQIKEKAESLGLVACNMHEGMYHLAISGMNEAMIDQKRLELANEGFAYTGEGKHPHGGESITFSYAPTGDSSEKNGER